MTSTRRVTSSGWGRGTTMERWPLDGEHGGDVQHVLGLEPEVELLDDGLGEQLDQGRRIGQGGDGDPADQLGGDPRHGGDVQADQGGHVAPLDLDHHPLAGPQGGRVDLGDGGRGDGHPVEGDEHVGQRPAEVLLDGPPDGGEGLGRDPVPQEPELLDQLLGEDPLARGDDLAQLDVGRPQPLEGRVAAGGTARTATTGVPRSRRPQPIRAEPSRYPTVATRPTEGRRWGGPARGPGAAASSRRASMSAIRQPGAGNRQVMAAGIDRPGAVGGEGPDGQIGTTAPAAARRSDR